MNARLLSKIDETGKITISLGGSCRLRCKHCYITTPQFQFQRRLQVKDIHTKLLEEKGSFSAICISGDIDPLLDQEGFISLLKMCSTEFSDCHLLFTTRLLPNSNVVKEIISAKERLAEHQKFVFPAVSFVTFRYPNEIEDEKQVPSTDERINLVKMLHNLDFPVLVAMRPTMPFSITPKHEVKKLIEQLSGICHAILGEIFIDDINETISNRLNLKPTYKEKGKMTFLEQSGYWVKSKYESEIEFAMNIASQNNIAFFMRSMSAVEYISENKNSVLTPPINQLLNHTGLYEKLIP